MKKISLAAMLLCVLGGSAAAQDSAPAASAAGTDAAQVQSIQVKGARERLVPYMESYALAKKVKEASNGRVAFGLRLIPATPETTLDNLQLWLGEGENATPVPVGEGGLFVVPINDSVAAEKGHYSINRKKGELKVRVALLPNVPRDAWTIGLMQQVVQDGQAAVKTMLPWYMRAFGIGVDAVAVCSPNAGMPVQVMNGDEVAATFTTDKKATNDIGRPVFCKHFVAADHLDASYKVVVPEGAEVLML